MYGYIDESDCRTACAMRNAEIDAYIAGSNSGEDGDNSGYYPDFVTGSAELREMYDLGHRDGCRKAKKEALNASGNVSGNASGNASGAQSAKRHRS